MSRRFVPSIAAVLALVALQSAMPSRTHACDEACDQACATRLVQSGKILPLSRLIVMAGIDQRGEILHTRLQCDGPWIYDFRMLDRTSNRTFGLLVNARTGVVVPRP